jgi:hypothetical protein
MKSQSNAAIANPAISSARWDTAEGLELGRLEVNVIFTDPQATVVALKTAGSLARDLGACIRLRAAIAVPYALPPDQPLVSVPFTERLLFDLVCRLELGALESSAHLYLCRDQVDTLLQVLRPNSLVVMGGREHWWPAAERRMAKALRSKGHRVVFIGLKTGTKSDLR